MSWGLAHSANTALAETRWHCCLLSFHGILLEINHSLFLLLSKRTFI